MDANTLNQKIEKLAVQKADEHIRRMHDAITKAAAATGHGRQAGDGTWFGDAFRAVLARWIVNSQKHGRDEQPLPQSPELVAYYRSKILEEVLEKLPLVKELAAMQDEGAS